MSPHTAGAVCAFTAREMAAHVRNRTLSVRELISAHIDRIQRLNPRVNAIVTFLPEQALQQAARADAWLDAGQEPGPLHGLPVVIKDLHDTAGIRTTYGSRLFSHHIPDNDEILVERLKSAGAILLGKSNTPEFGAGSQTFNEVFGVTRNPYALSKTCGGSSGGAAVALACGLSPLADGSDMGGSLRNPAGFCNVVGLRPAAGRVPHLARDMAWSTLSVHGPMARNVEDLTLFLSVIAGPDSRSPISLRDPGSAFRRPLARDFRGVRIAWMKDLGGVPFDPVVLTAIQNHIKTFETIGCIIEEAEPDLRGADEAFKTVRGWLFAAAFRELPANQRAVLKDSIRWEIERGSQLTGLDISRAEVLRTQLYHRMRAFFDRYEYFILPVTQVPPFDLQQPFVTEIAGTKMETYIDWMKSCYYISITGHPAISVPAGFTPDGLPVGLQIVGRYQDEWSLLQMAHAFEQATRFGDRRPPDLEET